MKGCPSGGGRLLVACGLGLVLFPCAALLAQDRQDQQVIEPTRQSVDLPQQDAGPSVPPVPEPTVPSTDYVIGPEDVLSIDVFNVPELSRLVVRVANDGTVSLPLLGAVRAAGMSALQLRNELEAVWGKSYLEKPQVAVYVQEFHSRPVSVIGAVEKPGLYQLTGPRTLIEMLSMAGGLAKRSSAPAGRTVYVTRKGGFEDFQPTEGMSLVASDKVEINLRRLLYSHEDALNIEIKPLDVIGVSKADIVYVVGNGARRPGGFVLEDREKITVLQALAMAEGFGPNASKGDARIIRTQADGSREQIPINLNKVLKGKSPDLELVANDILFVPDSSQKAALKRGLDATIATVSGLLIWRR
jgi:polysaccharide export outer membrane protein